MSDERAPCFVCKLPNQPYKEIGLNGSHQVCERCGIFARDPRSKSPELRKTQIKLSAFIREQNASNHYPFLDDDLIFRISRSSIPSIETRAMKLLDVTISRFSSYATDKPIFYCMLELEAVTYSAHGSELQFLAQVLQEKGYISFSGAVSFCVKVSGYIAAESASNKMRASEQAFVAMSFNSEFDNAYEHGFDPGIRSAGYAPMRIDFKEHANSISDEIQSEIRRSKFIVADYTGANNGVYFEAGFALGLGLPIIGTCRADAFDKLHFDIRHINTLKWHSFEDLAKNLSFRISAIFGDGPRKVGG